MNNYSRTMPMVAAPTILVIDDDADIRSDLQMILEDHGYRVIAACDGQAGLNLALTAEPDLIICDMMMPKMSGFIVLERVKQDHPRPTPFVMLTANHSDQQRTFAEFLGVDAYLNKPIGIKPLLDQLGRLCPLPAAKASRSTPAAVETVV
jgi:CheY-like chemotaxis protein